MKIPITAAAGALISLIIIRLIIGHGIGMTQIVIVYSSWIFWTYNQAKKENKKDENS